MTNKSISVVIPVFNEENLLTSTVNRCIKALSQSCDNYEIILIDDGSTDGTGKLMDILEGQNKNIKVLHNGVNLNVGISIQRGFMSAKYDYIVHNAVDQPLDPEDIIKLVEKMNDCDILVLQRNSYSGYRSWRIITSFFNRMFLKILYPIATKGIYDLNYTQIYKKNILQKITPLAKSPAFTTPEMIIRSRYLKVNVKTINVDYNSRTSGKGAFGKPHDILWSLYDMIRLRLKLWRDKTETIYGKK
jgi:glycosyltransferase involved in cell wall biosynthesis